MSTTGKGMPPKAYDRIKALPPERRALFERMRLARMPQPGVAPHLPRREDASQLPLSFTQQRLWFADQLYPDRCLYNEHGQLRLTGPLNLDRLRKSLKEVVRRQESLRLRIPVRNGAPAPEIIPDLDVALPCFDLTSFSAHDRQHELERLATEEARRPFQLATGPLFNIRAVRLAPEEHILFVTMHHAICDGWSMGVFAREVAALYPETDGTQLPPLRIQYADYAAWQRNNLETDELRKQVDYWKGQLEGANPALNLPLDGRFKDVRRFESGIVRASLSNELSGAVRSAAQSRGITPFAVLFAAFNILLARYTGENDLSVSVPVAGRGRAELDVLIGVFLNLLVFRTALKDNPSFDALVRRCQETAIAAYDHQDVPFDRLIAELQMQRSIERAPFCDVLFNFFNFPRSPLQLSGLTIERVDVHEPVARFPLTVYVEDLDGRFHIRLHYQAELFSKDRMACMLDQFCYLIEQAIAHPMKRASEYSLVTEAMRAVLPAPSLVLEAPAQPPVAELIQEQARRAPQAVAIEQTGVTCTYAELMERSESIAAALVDAGLKPGDCTAVTGPRSPELIAAMLGVFRARGVLLTLDPALPADRRRTMLEQSSARAILTGGAMETQLSANIPIQLALSSVGRKALDEGAGKSQPQEPAYIFFTSGTSAVPKAVLGWHKGLSHFLTWQRSEFGIRPGDRFAQLTGLSFDVVLRDIFMPLISGATLCLPEAGSGMGAHSVLPWLEQQAITGIHTTPSIAQSWIDATQSPRPLPALRHLFFAGEPLTDTLATAWRNAFSGPVEIVNLYGPTETTLAKCFYRVPANGHMPVNIQPVGTPMPQTQALVLRDRNRLCGPGEIGEITIRTPFRSLGYLNDRDQQRRFIPNPFRNDPDDLLYCTGDLGRYRADGLLDIAGRVDDEVKIRGVRVHPAEVSATLASHPSVASAFAGSFEDSLGQKALAAWFTVVPGHDPSMQGLRAWMASQLAAAAVPRAFVRLDALPLTTSGKIDRSRLPVPAPLLAQTAPRDETELRLYGIWQKVLRFQSAGVHDNFFELGGHSLIATELMHHIHEEFGAQLPLSAIFETPTLAGLAETIRHADVSPAVSTKRHWPLIVPDQAASQPFPLTDVQEAYWIGRSGSFELGDIATHNYSEFEFLDLDTQRFEDQFPQLIHRHGMLRAMVLPEGAQVILDTVPRYRIDVHDFSDKGGERCPDFDVLRRSLSHQVLPLGQWPLFQIVISRLDERRYIVHMSIDALICDAWSRRLLGRELLHLYQGCPGPLKPLELSFRDYVLGEHALRNSEQYREAERYWLDRLPTLPPAPMLPMAVKSVASAETKPHFTRFRSRLDAERWRILKRCAAQFGITPSALICATYAEVLGAWSTTRRFTINLTLFHRLPLHPQVKDIMGDFTSLVLLAVEGHSGSFEQRARTLQTRLWSDLDHSLYSGVKVLRKLSQMHGSAGRALMPVVLTSTLVDGSSENDELVSTWQGRLREGVSQTPQVYLDHSVSEQRGELVLNWDVIEEMFPEGLIGKMFGAYVGLLERLANEEGAWSEAGRMR
ncbi:MAG TPA: amino acid adenylation domain-containing protein, partial [Candidatus Angelobacter sp.]